MPGTIKSSSLVPEHYFPMPIGFTSTPYQEFSYVKEDISKFMNFRLLFPKDFESAAPDKVFPMLVMVHGKGEGGLVRRGNITNEQAALEMSNNDYQLLWGGKNHMDAVNSGEFPGFVLFPQSDYGDWQNFINNNNDFSDLLMELVEKLRGSPEYKIDPLRIYIWGLSNGGAGTVTAIERRPDLFAAAQPMCGWQNDPNTTDIYNRMAHMPIRYFHGEKDPLSYNYMEQELVKMGAAGGAGRQEFILDPNADHGVWHDAIKRKDFFSWFLKYSQLSILAFHGKDQVCPDEIKPNGIDLTINVQLGISLGHKEYEWSYNDTTNNDIISQGPDKHNINVNKLGKYYVRIKTYDTSKWSEWSEPLEIRPADPIAAPKIIASGSTFFPTLDGIPGSEGATSVKVSFPNPNEYSKYEWNYGSGIEQNIGNNGGGIRTIRVKKKNGCWSEYSDTLWISHRQKLNQTMTRPSAIVVEPVTEARINIFWKSNSPQNRGFEIYRAKADGVYSFVAKTERDEEFYTDSDLEAATTYTYIIRAVNATYEPDYRDSSPPTDPVSATTLLDMEAPSRPGNLVAKSNIALDGISLTWEPSIDNIGVIGYNVYQIDEDNNFTQVGTTDTTNFEIDGLPPNTLYTYVVRAKDKAGNLSEASNQAFVVTALCGLQYTFYVTDAAHKYASVNDFLPSQIAGTGIVNNFDIGIRSAHGENINDHFGFEFEGLINIEQAGTYTFELGSDDGSVLWINDEIVVNHDGDHSHTVKSGNKDLEVGQHLIKVRYFEIGGGESLELKYSGPGITNLISIPDEVLCNYPETSPPNVPANLVASDETLTSIKLSWEHNNSNAYGFELYRGRSEDSNFELVNTADLNTKEFTDTNLAAGTIYYYKVKAIGPEGSSGYSNIIYTSTLEDTEAPERIDDLEEINHADHTALLRWTAPVDNVGVTGYNIYQMKENNELVLLAQANESGDPSSESGSTFMFTALTSTFPDGGEMTLLNDTSPPIYFLLKGLTAGTTYNIVVTALDASNNESEASNTVSFTTSGISPLPIELISFSGKVEGSTVRLEWKTASEKNNDYFTVERAVNNKIFEETGRLDGAGTSIKELAYSFIDDFPVIGTLFYRLKQTDYNGDFEYSDIISVKYPSVTAVNNIELGNIILYPNPTSSENINLKAEDINAKGPVYLKIIDLLGKAHLEYQFDGNMLSEGLKVHTAHKLTPGIYIMMIEHANKVNKLKLIINE